MNILKRCSHADIFQLINCCFVYHYIFQTCQEIITFIPHRIKKHISLPKPLERPAHDPVPGIENRTLMHSSSHSRKKWERGRSRSTPLKQGKESMNPDHILIQMQGRGRGTVDLIQGTFTQISIIDREQDHLQKQEVFRGF